jgi:hypothetical protein
MIFRTEVSLPEVANQLSYRRNILMVGSCFTENIGNYLYQHLFPVMTNPCGILYNPASIADCINYMAGEKPICESDLFQANGLWNNFSFHSRYSHPDKESALKMMKSSVSDAAQNLKTASHLFLTFGTSWVYRDKENGNIVGNCHKLPASRFTRERLSVEMMTAQWISLLNNLLENYPELSIVLTVSPVRHMKDGSYENQVSKSALFLLIDNLRSHFKSEKLCYFPSYDLVMDELRDYRFYNNDMLHLSEVATAFVLEKFNTVFLDKESKQIHDALVKVIKSLDHRPFQAENSIHLDFLARLEEEILRLEKAYPFVSFERLRNNIIQKKSL